MSIGQHRWVVYATPQRHVKSFARAIAIAEGQWKPVAVPPLVVDAAVQALQPEAVVVAAAQPDAASLLERMRQRYTDRLVIDDRHLEVLTKLLSQAA